MIKKLIIASLAIILGGCVVSSKTVWDAQGCAYTMTTYVDNPSTPDDWIKETFTAGPSHTSRNRLADKPTCSSEGKQP